MRILAFASLFIAISLSSSIVPDKVLAAKLPNTQVSGVYEVVVGTDDLAKVKTYFEQFGFREIKRGKLTAKHAQKIYGVNSSATVIRMQNGDIDSHGMLRIIDWDTLISQGVGVAPPETIGQRMSVMRTKDVFRLADIFKDAREVSGQALYVKGPVYDDLYGLDSNTKFDVVSRRSGVREMGAYTASFNHIFFQRYGYTIPGYGTINAQSPLQTSEFTHHDFFVKGDITEVTQWYSSVLGFRAENEAVLDGEWQRGPREIFDMRLGGSHWYRGFVSPNNICGKMKFFTSPDPDIVADRSDRQALGHAGITMHTVWSPKLNTIRQLAEQNNLRITPVQNNEFGETSFVIYGPDGTIWQIIERKASSHNPTVRLEFKKTVN